MLHHSNNSNTDVRGAAWIKHKNRLAVGRLRKGVDSFGDVREVGDNGLMTT
jgi:hypothetical protein